MAVVSILLIWGLVFMEDAAIKFSKQKLFPFLAALAYMTSVVTIIIVKFDFLNRRQDHTLVLLLTGPASVTWSTYQASGDFNLVMHVFLFWDARHIVTRTGLRHLQHIDGPIHVCIAPLPTKKVPSDEDIVEQKVENVAFSSSAQHDALGDDTSSAIINEESQPPFIPEIEIVGHSRVNKIHDEDGKTPTLQHRKRHWDKLELNDLHRLSFL
jgi:hypothetical protein